MEMATSSAEQNAPFIFYCVKKIWGECRVYEAYLKDQINSTPSNGNGIYIFFLDAGQIQYPIYIGITGRNFRQRLLEHYANGVIDRYVNGNFPRNVPPIRLPLKVMCVPVQYPMQAKLMESVFLNSFDFCLNIQENGGIRDTIDTRDQFPPEHSKENFDIEFGNIMKEIGSFYDQYLHQWVDGQIVNNNLIFLKKADICSSR